MKQQLTVFLTLCALALPFTTFAKSHSLVLDPCGQLLAYPGYARVILGNGTTLLFNNITPTGLSGGNVLTWSKTLSGEIPRQELPLGPLTGSPRVPHTLKLQGDYILVLSPEANTHHFVLRMLSAIDMGLPVATDQGPRYLALARPFQVQASLLNQGFLTPPSNGQLKSLEESSWDTRRIEAAESFPLQRRDQLRRMILRSPRQHLRELQELTELQIGAYRDDLHFSFDDNIPFHRLDIDFSHLRVRRPNGELYIRVVLLSTGNDQVLFFTDNDFGGQQMLGLALGRDLAVNLQIQRMFQTAIFRLNYDATGKLNNVSPVGMPGDRPESRITRLAAKIKTLSLQD
jgi:hypothetical protein